MLRTGLTKQVLSRWFLIVALALAWCCWSRAQDLSALPGDRWQDLLLPRDLIDGSIHGSDPFSLAGRSQEHFRLFCMPAAFPSNPLALDIDNDPVDDASGGSAPSGPGDDRLQVSLGLDNPYFDFRRPGDPGGVGYYRMNSQFLLLDSRCAGLCVGLQAYTPAGLDADGIADGPTVLSPNFAWFYQVGDRATIQGFVGKNLRTRPGWTDGLERDIEYGLAFQRPFLRPAVSSNQNVQFFLEALGRYHYDTDPNQRPPSLHLIPGIHWQLSDSWWISGGLLMPFAIPRPESRLWQINCSWQF
jgi:hypothetical protein